MPSTSITVEAIARHYDRLSFLYRTFWGDHIHHGYWDSSQTQNEAQIALIEKLATRAEIRPGAQVLDVGCGLGGSSIWLARELECPVLGLTISPVQLEMARKRAAEEGVSDRVRFELEDANAFEYVESFDAIWVIECSEHLFDKRGFIRRAAAALRPGGVLAVCAWLRSDCLESAEHRDMVNRVCAGMLCPSLASKSEYCAWMREAGLRMRTADDITRSVSRTWDVCLKIARTPVVRRILNTAESDTLEFVKSFADIAQAYDEGAMSYGMFTAVKERPS
jgi:tocopherol O-methyltransferase